MANQSPALSLKRVNASIAAKGGAQQLVRGHGYYYFIDGGAEGWSTSSVLVYRLKHLTLEQWVQEWEHLLRSAKEEGRA
jgi:hypothetical protein